MPAQDALPRVGRLLRVIRKLVAYGTNLLNSLQAGVSTHREERTMHAFGTKDLALIVERIKCGLLRAAGLEVRLNRFVRRGCDLPPARERVSKPRGLPGVMDRAGWNENLAAIAELMAASGAGSDADSDALRAEAVKVAAAVSIVPDTAAAGAKARRARRAELLSVLPSAEEIAAQVRTRSIGLVIADICRDLGLRPGMVDGALWRELRDALVDCGVDLARFLLGCWRPLVGVWDGEVVFSVSALLAVVDEELAAVAGQPP